MSLQATKQGQCFDCPPCSAMEKASSHARRRQGPWLGAGRGRPGVDSQVDPAEGAGCGGVEQKEQVPLRIRGLFIFKFMKREGVGGERKIPPT